MMTDVPGPPRSRWASMCVDLCLGLGHSHLRKVNSERDCVWSKGPEGVAMDISDAGLATY